MDNNLSNNQAIIIGTIEDEFVFNHEIYAEKFYTFTVKVPRLSGASDNVTSGFRERLDLLYGCLHIFCFGIRHRLDQNRISASDDPVADFHNSCICSAHCLSSIYFLRDGIKILFYYKTIFSPAQPSFLLQFFPKFSIMLGVIFFIQLERKTYKR